MKVPFSLEKSSRQSTEYSFLLFPTYGCFLMMFHSLKCFLLIGGPSWNCSVANADLQSGLETCCY